MRPHLLSICFGLAVGLALSGVVEAQQASAKKAKETKKEVTCWDTAGSQIELNMCAGKDTEDTKKEMEKVLAEIAIAYKSEPNFLKHMEQSQKAWMAWMVLEAEAHYPADETGFYRWGTVRPMCQLGLQARFIVKRTRDLKAWLAPSDDEEGDVCGGIYQTYGRR